jgi:hypothetical protein
MGFVAELERVDRGKSRTHSEAPGRPNPYLAARRSGTNVTAISLLAPGTGV